MIGVLSVFKKCKLVKLRLSNSHEHFHLHRLLDVAFNSELRLTAVRCHGFHRLAPLVLRLIKHWERRRNGPKKAWWGWPCISILGSYFKVGIKRCIRSRFKGLHTIIIVWRHFNGVCLISTRHSSWHLPHHIIFRHRHSHLRWLHHLLELWILNRKREPLTMPRHRCILQPDLSRFVGNTAAKESRLNSLGLPRLLMLGLLLEVLVVLVRVRIHTQHFDKF